jgi:hypothetical protein
VAYSQAEICISLPSPWLVAEEEEMRSDNRRSIEDPVAKRMSAEARLHGIIEGGSLTTDRSILSLVEEDYRVRAPSMPSGLSKARGKARKAILTSADIRTIIAAAKSDPDHGIYYAFPFLVGTRPRLKSECRSGHGKIPGTAGAASRW